MKQLDLLLPIEEHTYSIFIGSGLLGRINTLINFSAYSKLFIITDRTIEKIQLPTLAKGLPHRFHVIALDAGEREKNIENTKAIWLELLRLGADRKSCIINLGGGVVGDLGGFVASTYMRGIDFIQIPTTLLAQVDASVGGKVAIDFADVKNLIGSFCQPKAVIIDPETLTTLTKAEFISGFGEIIKHGLIRDKKYFEFAVSKHPKSFTLTELEEIIEKSCRIKASIVEEDEKESGARKLLNFGHTVGHAIESLSHNTSRPLRHGEAISIGMVAEGKISVLSGSLKENEFQTIEAALIHAELPTKATGISQDIILSLIRADKKNNDGKILWTLLSGIGAALFNQEVDQAVIKSGIEYILR